MDPAENPPVFYSNAAQVTLSVFDVAIMFGVKRQDESMDRICEMHMSPQHAKVLTRILAEHLKVYESQFGVIPEPKKKGGEDAE